MIKGLTHDTDGNLHKITKYQGKISTGYAPKEHPNKDNYPKACGHFRMLKEITKTERIGTSTKMAVKKEWVENKEVQEKLNATVGNATPRKIEVVSLYKTIDEMWESSLSAFTKADGLVCKSNGEGTNARYLNFGPNGEREWVDREFNGNKGCLYKTCPDFVAKKCKPFGLLKCFPVVDLTPLPYRLETASINTILGIESSLSDLWSLLQAAHAIRQLEAKKELPFDGFFGMKLELIHRKKNSGGREVYITDIRPTKEFTEIVMSPIKRWMEGRGKSANLLGADGSVSVLGAASQKLLASAESEADSLEDLPPSDQSEIAVNFGMDEPEEAVVVETEQPQTQEGNEPNVADVTETMLEGGSSNNG